MSACTGSNFKDAYTCTQLSLTHGTLHVSYLFLTHRLREIIFSASAHVQYTPTCISL